MSWTEPADTGFAVKVAKRDKAGWSAPRMIVESEELFVNWADFPSVAAFPDGMLAAHWLRETGDSGYGYEVNIALSADEGRTWREPLRPHREWRSSQYGFVTLLPIAHDKMLAVWLDGRDYDLDGSGENGEDPQDSIQIRATIIASDGTMSEDTLLDPRACTCCQTSAAATESGSVLVAYRDRTVGEVRDISVIRLVNGVGSEPIVVHRDGWEISGCPVNGPVIDADEEEAVVAWFTAAENDPAVKVAFSKDNGATFENAIRIDRGNPVGRVDAVLLDDGSAIVSWIEATAIGEVLLVCRVSASGCGTPQAITLNRAGGSINFPRMVRSKEGIYIAWSQPGPKPTIRMVFAKM